MPGRECDVEHGRQATRIRVSECTRVYEPVDERFVDYNNVMSGSVNEGVDTGSGIVEWDEDETIALRTGVCRLFRFVIALRVSL